VRLKFGRATRYGFAEEGGRSGIIRMWILSARPHSFRSFPSVFCVFKLVPHLFGCSGSIIANSDP
jgi:hypothetical protein